MRRPALYSSSRSERPAPESTPSPAPEGAQPATPAARSRRIDLASPKLLWAAILLLSAALVALSLNGMQPQRRLTQDDINKAVLKTMETQVMPSEYARAYDNVRPSVVRVVGYVKKSRLKEALEKASPGEKAKPKPLARRPRVKPRPRTTTRKSSTASARAW